MHENLGTPNALYGYLDLDLAYLTEHIHPWNHVVPSLAFRGKHIGSSLRASLFLPGVFLRDPIARSDVHPEHPTKWLIK
jgi:hypothetical protein